MSNYLTTDTELTSVANAIRTKGGTVGQLTYPTGFVTAIENIPTSSGSSYSETLVWTNPDLSSNFGAQRITTDGISGHWVDVSSYDYIKIIFTANSTSTIDDYQSMMIKVSTLTEYGAFGTNNIFPTIGIYDYNSSIQSYFVRYLYSKTSLGFSDCYRFSGNYTINSACKPVEIYGIKITTSD